MSNPHPIPRKPGDRLGPRKFQGHEFVSRAEREVGHGLLSSPLGQYHGVPLQYEGTYNKPWPITAQRTTRG